MTKQWHPCKSLYSYWITVWKLQCRRTDKATETPVLTLSRPEQIVPAGWVHLGKSSSHCTLLHCVGPFLSDYMQSLLFSGLAGVIWYSSLFYSRASVFCVCLQSLWPQEGLDLCRQLFAELILPYWWVNTAVLVANAQNWRPHQWFSLLFKSLILC